MSTCRAVGEMRVIDEYRHILRTKVHDMVWGHGKRTLGIICVAGPRTDVLEGTLFLTWTGGGSFTRDYGVWFTLRACIGLLLRRIGSYNSSVERL